MPSFRPKVLILTYNGSDTVVIEMLVIALCSASGLWSNDPIKCEILSDTPPPTHLTPFSQLRLTPPPFEGFLKFTIFKNAIIKKV